VKDGVPERKANRLATYNYSQSGVYFITICSKNKRCTFGTIVGGGVPDAPRTRLSPTGKIVARQLGNMIAFYPHVRIEKYVVMPNHIHLLIAIQQGPSGGVEDAAPYIRPRKPGHPDVYLHFETADQQNCRACTLAARILRPHHPFSR